MKVDTFIDYLKDFSKEYEEYFEKKKILNLYAYFLYFILACYKLLKELENPDENYYHLVCFIQKTYIQPKLESTESCFIDLINQIFKRKKDILLELLYSYDYRDLYDPGITPFMINLAIEEFDNFMKDFENL